MHFRRVFRLIGLLVFFLGLSMAIPVLVSLLYKDGSTWALGYSMAFTCSAGLLMYVAARREEATYLSHRDGVIIVTFACAATGAPAWRTPCR